MTRKLDEVNNTTGLIPLGNIPGAAPVAAHNVDQIHNLIATKGISALHYKSAYSPSRETVTGPIDPNTKEAKWARRFFQVRPLDIVPQNFSLENRLNVQGVWGMHSVILNVAGHYKDAKPTDSPVYCRPGDLIVFDKDPEGNSVTVEVPQLFEYNPNGPQKLNFRIEGVVTLFDRDKTYTEMEDFVIDNGAVRWLGGGKKPSFVNGKGAVLSIVYYAKPIYVVENVPHSVRILLSNQLGNGGLPREATYAPQLVVAKQSWIREDKDDLLDFSDIPEYPKYRDSKNTTGGTF